MKYKIDWSDNSFPNILPDDGQAYDVFPTLGEAKKELLKYLRTRIEALQNIAKRVRQYKGEPDGMYEDDYTDGPEPEETPSGRLYK